MKNRSGGQKVKMRILVVSQYFYPENFRVNMLSEELVKRGHEVTVLTGYPQYPQGSLYDGYGFNLPYDRVWHGVDVQRVKVLPRGSGVWGLLMNCLSFVYEGIKWVRNCKTKFDIIYVFEVSPATVGIPAVAYKKKFDVPLLFNVQDLWPESVEVVLGIRNRLLVGVLNRIVDSIYAASDRILCSSKGFVTNIAARGVEKEKLVFWPQFCMEPDLTGSAKPSVYKGGNFNIVFAGNIGDAQGLDLLIDAADQLKDSNIRWFLIGDGRARARLEKRVQAHALQDRVFFIGKVSEGAANVYVHYADCAYLSFMDNTLFNMVIPAKLQTYLACGTPILAVASGESRKIVEEARCGYACGQNISDVVDTIRRMMTETDNLQVLSRNARRYYLEHFTVDTVVRELENVMRSICARDKEY